MRHWRSGRNSHVLDPVAGPMLRRHVPTRRFSAAVRRSHDSQHNAPTVTTKASAAATTIRRRQQGQRCDMALTVPARAGRLNDNPRAGSSHAGQRGAVNESPPCGPRAVIGHAARSFRRANPSRLLGVSRVAGCGATRPAGRRGPEWPVGRIRPRGGTGRSRFPGARPSRRPCPPCRAGERSGPGAAAQAARRRRRDVPSYGRPAKGKLRRSSPAGDPMSNRKPARLSD
jgi:hypothetical protein